ncbi:LysE family translocator [Paroceanicella profunda]|uniref:LysE family translocator n=1 Tax=Paroceanicella profunda TaxID=2579971 RepID=A0A5B8FXK3_9RHOB|nr:LysE family translocator [Paroceanicella profunda]QDL91242.1 LysE family translocator [Paroceanicella profunda]
MPVELGTYLAFVGASILLLLLPGPTVLTVISQSLAHGRRTALPSVLGVGLGDLCAASLSLLGVGTLLAASATAFEVMKFAGAAYLVWMGVKMWRNPPGEALLVPVAPARRRVMFRDAALVTLFNPKAILFFVAFVPQFIRHDAPFAPQAAVLVVTFSGLGMLNSWAYAALANRARGLIRRPAVLRRATRGAAAMLIAAGVASAFTRRAA